MPLDFPTPDPLNLAILEQQLAAAGLATTVLLLEEIRLADLDEPSRADAERAFAAHATETLAEHEQALAEVTNEKTIRDRLAAAISANAKDISDTEAWLTANPAASAILRSLAQQSVRQAKQLSGLERLILRRLDATE